MRARESLDAPEALVLTMVLVAAADGGMTDREIGVMSGQVQTLPVFHDVTTEQLRTVTDAAVKMTACSMPRG
jgi:tellurite resistance protein